MAGLKRAQHAGQTIQDFIPEDGLIFGAEFRDRIDQVRMQIAPLEHKKRYIRIVPIKRRSGSRFLQGNSLRRMEHIEIKPLNGSREVQPGVEQIAGIGMNDAQTKGDERLLHVGGMRDETTNHGIRHDGIGSEYRGAELRARR